MPKQPKKKPPLKERLLSERPSVQREAEIELRDRVLELLVSAGFVTREKLDQTFKIAKDFD